MNVIFIDCLLSIPACSSVHSENWKAVKILGLTAAEHSD